MLLPIAVMRIGADLEIGAAHYKRLPQGFADAEGWTGRLVRHRGLFATERCKVPVGLHGDAFLAHCLASWRRMLPLNRWLVDTFG